MKKLFTFILFFSCLSFVDLSATTYFTVSAGNLDAGGTWDAVNGKPPTTLPVGCEIIINHAIDLNKNLTILGKLTINSGGSLIGGKDLTVEYPGDVINNGILTVSGLTVNDGTSAGDSDFPKLTNTGTVTVNGDSRIGNNDGFGGVVNSGTFIINGNLHLDNYFTNSGSLTVTGELRNHGGTITGSGGTIENCNVTFSANTGRPGSLAGQDLCCNFSNDTEASYTVGGNTYTTLSGFVTNQSLSSTDHNIDASSFYSCGVNALGQSLPVELLSFSVKLDNQNQAFLSWTTASELNNEGFYIERTGADFKWTELGFVDGMGTTQDLQSYTFTDTKPLDGKSYYRLKQADFDGKFDYSGIVSLEVQNEGIGGISVFPNPTSGALEIDFPKSQVFDGPVNLFIFDYSGKQVWQKEQSGNETVSVSVANLPMGIYVLRIQQGTQNFQKRITKN